jgi:hypothetical protein
LGKISADVLSGKCEKGEEKKEESVKETRRKRKV